MRENESLLCDFMYLLFDFREDNDKSKGEILMVVFCQAKCVRVRDDRFQMEIVRLRIIMIESNEFGMYDAWVQVDDTRMRTRATLISAIRRITMFDSLYHLGNLISIRKNHIETEQDV